MLEAHKIVEGTVLADRYEVIERIGSGGMATVYLAEDRVLGREVAVKRMRSEGGDTDSVRFRREARLGATLSHPNVVTVFDTVAGEDGLLIVMEYVAGETLADALDRGPLDPDRAIEVLSAVAAALDHAHRYGIVHRDVKPANVLLGEDGTVKLGDLGIATAAEATRITTANDIVGTLAYISPERLEDSSPGGPEADVYSLAVLAYETLGGEPMHRGSTPAEVVHRAAAAPPPDLRESWPEAPAEAVYALQAALSRDPRKRPESAGAFVERLENALESDPHGAVSAAARRVLEESGPGVDAEPPAVPPPPREPEVGPRSDRGRGPRLALVAIVGLLLAGFAALVISIAGGADDPAGETTPAAEAGGGDSGESGAKDGSASGEDPAADGEEPAPAEEQAPPADSGGPQASAPESSGSGAALNDQGYALIQSGSYEEAIPVLQSAVESFPEGTSDLNYAYALFNLGNALRLAGRPEEAIPILEQRLAIPNQAGIVKRELELARAEAGAGGSEEPAGDDE